MPLTLRLATLADVPAMLAIYTPYVQNTTVSFEYTPPSQQEFAQRLAAIQAEFAWLVCEVNGQIIGYAYASRFGVRAGYGWATELSVYIAAGQHGHGAGRALYTALLAAVQQQGYIYAYARIATPNPESEGFHTRMGFVKEATLQQVGYKLGRYVDMSYYKKQLLPSLPNPVFPLPFSQLKAEVLAQILQNSTPTTGE
ncbi:N-acetyltransferase family protein [Ruminococcaceae bacterium OttesenSCG-928-A16]|nr:N-acetyltransferase family protein [Ruminococcaceae bacterium OttesenSCG-928-A16]